MIVAFSTSSPQASVALLSSDGILIGSGEEMAPRRASGACIDILSGLLSSTGRSLKDATLFVADVGPGSFTGVRVGVTLTKTLAYANGVLCSGVSSFDLISVTETVVVPSKKGEWFIRKVGEEPVKTNEEPQGGFIGYGAANAEAYPHAKNVGPMLATVEPVSPMLLVPTYHSEPAISVPKRQYGLAGNQVP